jgi:hypothetical protein
LKVFLATLVLSLIMPSLFVHSASAADGDVNLLGPDGSASIVLAEAYTGLIDNAGEPTGLAGIYNIAPVTAGSTVFARDVQCSDSWRWYQILCDNAPTTNMRGTVTQTNANTGATFNNRTNAYGYYVIDLGAVASFSSFEVFQMFSDGKTTQVSLLVSTSFSDDRPAWNDPSWREVIPKSAVGPGLQTLVSGGQQVTLPTVFDFDTQQGRYVLLKMWNDGSYGNPSWIESSGVKLFGGLSPMAPQASWTTLYQGLPMPSSLVCEDVQDAGFDWGTGITGGWQRAWEPWAGTTPGVGGWACTRSLVNKGGNLWSLG